MIHRSIRIGLAVLAGAAMLAVACGSGSDNDEFPRVVSLGDGEVFPVILNDSLIVGENRLVLSLTDVDDELVRDAAVSLRFFDLNDGDQREASSAEARFVPIQLSYIDEQAPEPEPTDAGSGGVYIANVSFDRAGDWGLKALVTVDGAELEEAPFRFTVIEDSAEPSLGDVAPSSVQATLETVAQVEDIDSSFPPRPEMHDITIAAALESGRPLVIAFATPAYCRSRTCAPVMDTVMDPLFERYSNEAEFIHVEPFELRDLRAGFVQNPVPATREWGLQSEPWVFVVDRAGQIAGKFQGPTAVDEVEAALQKAISS